MSVWQQLANTPFAQTFRDWESGFPAMESVHLVGLAIFFGSIGLLDLRVIGLGPRLAMRGVKALCLPLTWIGFTLLTVSGTVLFVAAADQYARTWSFPLKMLAIAFGGINALYFHMDDSGDDTKRARIGAYLSLVIWLAAIVAGRWLGYERHP